MDMKSRFIEMLENRKLGREPILYLEKYESIADIMGDLWAREDLTWEEKATVAYLVGLYYAVWLTEAEQGKLRKAYLFMVDVLEDEGLI